MFAVTNVSWRVLRCQLADRLKMEPERIDEMAKKRPQDIRDFLGVINAESKSKELTHKMAQRQAKAKGRGRR